MYGSRSLAFGRGVLWQDHTVAGSFSEPPLRDTFYLLHAHFLSLCIVARSYGSPRPLSKNKFRLSVFFICIKLRYKMTSSREQSCLCRRCNTVNSLLLIVLHSSILNKSYIYFYFFIYIYNMYKV